ncbi:MAG: hypothetical protein R8G01_22285 [Ilumatobacteraceae bacterium]|nr:hypothetical protein [Ilumatobacteraceae bacterium]
MRDGDCLFVGGGAPGLRTAVLWPFGTTWDAEAQEVVGPDGTRIPPGSTLSAGGGFGSPEMLEHLLVDDALAARVDACAEGEFRELAYVQHSISVVQTGSSTETPDSVEAPSVSGWRQLPDPPLSARSAAIVADLDGRLVVTGGWELLCPPAAECVVDDVTRFVDGAIYDPGTDQWTPIADAPVPIVAGASTTSGGDLYVTAACVGDSACANENPILRYRSADDAWDILPTPDRLASPMLTSLSDGTVIAFNSSDEQGETPDYRLVDDSGWEPLPDDPLPAVYDRFVLGTGQQIFVFGSPIDGDAPSKLGAVLDVDNQTWTELTASNAAGYQVWAGDDGYYLNPHFGPSVQGGVYDPATDTWADFPQPPASDSWRNDMAGILADNDATYEYAYGWARDTTTDQWIEIPARPGAPTDGESITNSERSLVVYGGQDWTGEQGRLLNEIWTWTPPSTTD